MHKYWPARKIHVIQTQIQTKQILTSKMDTCDKQADRCADPSWSTFLRFLRAAQQICQSNLCQTENRLILCPRFASLIFTWFLKHEVTLIELQVKQWWHQSVTANNWKKRWGGKGVTVVGTNPVLRCMNDRNLKHWDKSYFSELSWHLSFKAFVKYNPPPPEIY